ncbi:Predicted oxidoreductase, contains short-chain dehydrogenase (SDR) and DUF2520 domains [Amycolatopsis arida]|uniref:Predicted oxidoreductase, contains short-chain dehydrogenase (SDR) and DUF2520 domains n=1 Tax=Amycolatopsis arida TaxID=587909 RepID=A0A1I5R6Z2_9PSEU|nr:DUF2520 domain-containing protein [Amycolatopsis arida]TDX99089.1 putative short-subunit dehydrogenase-like oxidoreductase (DUF2520 family) [Amycolatopsis arida]SFP53786.1 Predicted oxidoreductase, contains short-chain dehydrogenase (SDR) and DUF2520 domains [Amycolatopsis arida]
MTRPARLAIGVVSAGRVGSVLGAALARAGHTIVAASGISADSLRRAERLLPGVPLLPADEVARRADLVLLAVPDDALPGIVRGLVATASLRAGQIVVHTSGAHGIEVLRPAAELGVLPLALHPVMTFTGRAEDLERMATCCVGVTAAAGDDAAWNVGEALTVEMGAEPVRVPEAARPLYHAALAHGANHLVTLVADCAELLRGCDIDGVGDAERLLGPLLSAALDNVLRHGDRALTGPVARGDTGTVRAHLAVLADRAPDVLPSYTTLARRTVARATASGVLGGDAAAELTALLDNPADGRNHL